MLNERGQSFSQSRVVWAASQNEQIHQGTIHLARTRTIFENGSGIGRIVGMLGRTWTEVAKLSCRPGLLNVSG